MSTSYTIRRAEGALDKRDQIVDIAISRWQFSESYFSGVRSRIPRYYDLWRGIWTGRFHPHKNNVHIPLIYSAIWSDAARKASTSLSLWPILTFLGYGPDDYAQCRKWEALVSAQMKDMDLFMKEVDNFVTADLYGTSVTQLGWKRERAFRILEDIQRAPLTDKIIRTVRKGEIITFDGPDTEPVDRLDCGPQPGVKRLKDMQWFCRRRFLDLDEVRALAKAGMFEQSEVDRMISDGGVGAAQATDMSSVQRFQVRTGMDEASARWMDRYSRPVEIIEMWGTIPTELAPDGDTHRVITIANRRYLLRNKPSPFWHKQLPFLAFSPTPDPHYFDAPGKAEVAEKLNIVANRYINQSLDVGDLIVDPVWFYDRAANLNTNNLVMRPGKFIPIDGNPNDVLSPLQANLNHLAVADQKVMQMRELAQMATAIQEDVVQGLGGDQRQTAREFLGRREAAGTRLMLESRLYEEMYLEKLGNMMIALNKQFLEPPVEVMILGDSAEMDPVTQSPIMATRVNLDEYDLTMNYFARAMGATTGLSKSMRRQDLIQLLTAMGTPLGQAVMPQINAINFWRGIFREFEVPNINEIFSANPMLQQLLANSGFGSAAQVPTSGQIAGGAAPLPMPGMASGQPTPPNLNMTLPAA